MGKKRSALHIYRSYNFVDKDPAIDVVRTAVESSAKSYREIKELGGPATTTLYNWFDGKTRRPQACTLAATMLSIGGDVVYRMPDGGETSLKKLTIQNTIRLAPTKRDARQSSIPVAKVLDLHEKGMGASKIAAKLRIGRSTVYRVLES